MTSVISNLCGHKVVGRCGDDGDDVWLKRMNRLGKMAVIEEHIFESSVELVLNKKSCIVTLDDELILMGSQAQAKDVECKKLINKKAGNDGPVADCVADSCTAVMFGMKLRVKGKTELDNATILFARLPTITHMAEWQKDV